jgi:predicted metalloprotease
MRRLAVLLLLACSFALAGCGATDDLEREVERARTVADEVRADIEQRVRKAQDDFERAREKYGKRIEQVLDDVQKQFERPEQTSPVVRSEGDNQPRTIDVFMTDVLQDIDRFWTRTFAAADLPEPRVAYQWIPPGGSAVSACGVEAGDDAAFYCPADDTIYVAQQFAAALYEGVLEGLPGEGRAAGDFAVAYVLAHEYAHNLQQELGIFDNRVSRSARPFELHADCFSGVWAYSVFAEGALSDQDLEEVLSAARAVGDFDVGNEQHHGTPEERRAAVLSGYESGEPGSCSQLLT